MKRFPFTKRAIEALSAHAMDSLSREGEYTDMECMGCTSASASVNGTLESTE